MRGLFYRLMAGCLLVLLLASCESKKPVWITEADNGQTLTVVNGDTLEVQLWGNPTTGYTWNQVALTTNALVPMGNPEFESDSSAAGLGGMYYFCYRAEEVGKVDLQLTYNCAGKPDEPPAKVFEITLVIQP